MDNTSNNNFGIVKYFFINICNFNSSLINNILLVIKIVFYKKINNRVKLSLLIKNFQSTIISTKKSQFKRIKNCFQNKYRYI